MKKLFKRVSILFAALMALSVSTVRTVEEVKAETTPVAILNLVIIKLLLQKYYCQNNLYGNCKRIYIIN